jgi:hypothetical protein
MSPHTDAMETNLPIEIYEENLEEEEENNNALVFKNA